VDNSKEDNSVMMIVWNSMASSKCNIDT